MLYDCYQLLYNTSHGCKYTYMYNRDTNNIHTSHQSAGSRIQDERFFSHVIFSKTSEGGHKPPTPPSRATVCDNV